MFLWHPSVKTLKVARVAGETQPNGQGRKNKSIIINFKRDYRVKK